MDSLFEDDWLVKASIDRVGFAYSIAKSRNQKLYVAFSGGKDSIVLKEIVRLYAESIGRNANEIAEFHYNSTTIDPPPLIEYIRKNHKDVRFDYPPETMWQIILRHNFFPTPFARFCCAELKETKGHDKVCLTGVRWAESYGRKTKRAIIETSESLDRKAVRIKFNDNTDRRIHELCMQNNQNIINPIVDWNDDEIWGFIRERKLPYCSLYDEGYKRLGCIGCPMNHKEQRFSFERFPHFFFAYLSVFSKFDFSKLDFEDADHCMRVFIKWGKFKEDGDYCEWKSKLLLKRDEINSNRLKKP